MMKVLPLAFALLVSSAALADEATKPLPPPALDRTAPAMKSETAVLAGGCFWGMQGVFQHVKGVSEVVSGYAGGKKDTAQYETVSGGDTGHAESIRITFDPRQVSFGQILRVYFSVMDPTELDYQGPDHGTQYRSEIFATSPTQAKIAAAYVAQLDKAHAFQAPIVTKLGSFTGFYPAEDYHQDYLIHHPNQPYIAYNDIPKVETLKALYPSLWRDKPVMVFPQRS
ncbi:MAG: peptide-methionine (S)-S-oxide reductase MsrA [Alphaproteobacteria bacterium]|nr:peptide-methionine (S)-S-oxide reductase MsrA [Alphaproteobacteria bacterium]